MWLPRDVEFRVRELDFSSAGLGRHRTTAVFADGVEIVNALDLVDLTEEPIQVAVCEDCGTPGCAPGGRVDLRKLGDGLVMMPAFAAMATDEWSHDEYRPPLFMADRGILWFVDRALAALRDRVSRLADPSTWPALSLRECAWVQQWEAPGSCLGVFPDAPRTDTRSLIATDGRDPLEFARALDRRLDEAYSSSDAATLVRGRPVGVYLALPGTPRWTPMVERDDQYLLSPAPGFGVATTDSA